jgi:hypothetical protein
MGEAKKKQRIAQRILAQHRSCCLCGGQRLATSIDHVPPKIVFWGKRRPSGLEVPACGPCNQGTRKLDQAAGLFARIRVGDTSPEQQAEFERIAQSVTQNFPGWTSELAPTPAQARAFHDRFGDKLATAEPANLGPLADDAIYTIAAKLGLALHYTIASQIVPPAGSVVVRYETNASLPENGLPAELLEQLSPVAHLTQGEWTSDGHFAYRRAVLRDGAGGVYLAHVGRAFLIVAFVFLDGRAIPSIGRHSRTFRPGDLEHADAKALARYGQLAR